MLLADTGRISAPSVSYHALAPILIVLGAALVGVLAEAFVPRAERYAAQLVITVMTTPPPVRVPRSRR